MGEDKKTKREKAFVWQKNATTQYNLRFMNATGVPEALNRAKNETGEAPSEYMKTAVVNRLREEGFLDKDAQVVLNLNKQRHREKIKKLEEYIEREKQKMK